MFAPRALAVVPRDGDRNISRLWEPLLFPTGSSIGCNILDAIPSSLLSISVDQSIAPNLKNIL